MAELEAASCCLAEADADVLERLIDVGIRDGAVTVLLADVVVVVVVGFVVAFNEGIADGVVPVND